MGRLRKVVTRSSDSVETERMKGINDMCKGGIDMCKGGIGVVGLF